MSEQNQPQTADSPKAQHVIFTVSIATIEGQEPMVVHRTTVDGKVVEVPFALIIGDDGGFQVAQVPQDADGASHYSTALMKMALGIASRILKAAKGDKPTSQPAKAA